jgi:hypothetical protein
MLSFRKMVAQGAPNSMYGFPVQGIFPGNTPNSIRPKKLPQDHTWYLFLPQSREIIARSEGQRIIGSSDRWKAPIAGNGDPIHVPEILNQS